MRLEATILLFGLLVALPAGPARAEEPATAPSAPGELPVLGEAPGLELPLAGGDSRIRLEDLLEKGPVLVDFWATWCAPCRKALPAYAALQERFGERGFTVLAVSQDAARHRDKVLAFAREHELPFPVVLDAEREAGRAFGVRSLPTAFLVDGQGRVRSLVLGWRPGDQEHLAGKIEALLPPESD